MVKDRLNELHATLLSNNEEYYVGAAHQSELIKSLTEEVAQIGGNIDTVQWNIEQIKKKQSALIGSPMNDEVARKAYDNVVAQTNELLRNVHQQLQQLGASNEQNKSRELLTIRKTQHIMLTRKFITLLTDYNQTQISFRDEIKRKLRRQLDITGVQMNEDELEKIMERGDVHSVFAQKIMITDPLKAKQALTDIGARHSDIMQLESSIQELHDMILDMALLVESQGEVVNRIDYNVNQAHDYTTTANHEIIAAKASKKKARRKKIILNIIGATVFVIVIGVVFVILHVT